MLVLQMYTGVDGGVNRERGYQEYGTMDYNSTYMYFYGERYVNTTAAGSIFP